MYSGEEIIIFLNNVKNHNDIYEKINKIRKSIEENVVNIQGKENR